MRLIGEECRTSCSVPETIEHFLLDCKYSKVSRLIRKYCQEESIEPKLETIPKSHSLLDKIYANLDRKL